MNQELKNQLLNICFEYRNILNSVLSQQGGNISGTCYLTGHVLTSLFERLGFSSKEISGVLYLRNDKGEYMIYGGDELENEGVLIGNYHTWCEISIDGIGVLNSTKLQYENEPARHKLLDIVGDLALIGKN